MVEYKDYGENRWIPDHLRITPPSGWRRPSGSEENRYNTGMAGQKKPIGATNPEGVYEVYESKKMLAEEMGFDYKKIYKRTQKDKKRGHEYTELDGWIIYLAEVEYKEDS